MNNSTTAKRMRVFLQSHRQVIFLFAIFWLPVIAFLKLAGEIVEKEPLGFDNQTLLFLHSHATAFYDALFTTLTNLGGLAGVLVVTLGLGLYFAHTKAYQKLFLLATGVGGAMAANIILKFLFHRDRPSLWQHAAEKGFSFPSGHAMASAALATALVIIFWKTKYRWVVVATAALLTFLIGLSRLYLGVHYPSDVLAGWSVSVAWVVLVAVILRRFRW